MRMSTETLQIIIIELMALLVEKGVLSKEDMKKFASRLSQQSKL